MLDIIINLDGRKAKQSHGVASVVALISLRSSGKYPIAFSFQQNIKEFVNRKRGDALEPDALEIF